MNKMERADALLFGRVTYEIMESAWRKPAGSLGGEFQRNRREMTIMQVRVPIRFSDFDRFEHVNHTRVLVFCEEHRTEMFTQIEVHTGERWYEFGLVVARVEADYRRPIEAGSRAAIVEAALVKIGRTSMQIRYRIGVEGSLAADVLATLVRTDSSGSPVAVSEPAREWLRTHLAVESQQVPDE